MIIHNKFKSYTCLTHGMVNIFRAHKRFKAQSYSSIMAGIEIPTGFLERPRSFQLEDNGESYYIGSEVQHYLILNNTPSFSL